VGVVKKGVPAKQWCCALEHLLWMLIGCGAESLFVWLPRYLHLLWAATCTLPLPGRRCMKG